MGPKTCAIRADKIKEPLAGYSLTAEWTTGSLLQAAKEAGITRINYIDQQILSIRGGLYKRETPIVHGGLIRASAAVDLPALVAKEKCCQGDENRATE